MKLFPYDIDVGNKTKVVRYGNAEEIASGEEPRTLLVLNSTTTEDIATILRSTRLISHMPIDWFEVEETTVIVYRYTL